MKELRGLAVVPGTALGRLLVLRDELAEALALYVPQPLEAEKGKMLAAAAEAAQQLAAAAARCREAGQEEQAAILEAHQLMALDPSLTGAMEAALGPQGAPAAVLGASEEYAAVFASMEDAYLRERAADVRDVGKRMARIILGVHEAQPPEEGAVLAAEDIEPSYLASLPAGAVKAVVLGQGSTTSHSIIIAKARAIPAVVGLHDSMECLQNGMEIFVDGAAGRVCLEPDEEVRQKALRRIAQESLQKEQDLAMAQLPAVTGDGVRLTLAANIGSPDDMETAAAYGAEGVGLFRTEFLFMGRAGAPDEEEQYQAYRKAIECCGGHLCVIRTMDIGGDKPLHYLQVGREDNPFLGWRAIRISLEREDLFLPQLKAILRAAAHGPAAVMLPMVSQVEEVRAARQCLARAKEELRQEGKPVGEVSVGIMVETPAAAAMSSLLAAECDFFSIGTNDLVQYTLAVDRVNPKISSLYSHFHPAVLRLIRQTVEAGKEAGIWVGMCGEMAGDPLATPLLVAMGLDELSMSAPALPRVKERVRALTLPAAQRLLAEALALPGSADIRALLQQAWGREQAHKNVLA